MARRLTWEIIEQVKTPPWELCQSLGTLELFEALDRKFGPGAPEQTGKRRGSGNMIGWLLGTGSVVAAHDPYFSWDHNSARFYYLLNLVIAGRQDEAVKLAAALGEGEQTYFFAYGAADLLQRAGESQAAFDFFHAQLTADPRLPFWDIYIKLAALANQSDHALTLLEASLQRRDLPVETRDELQRMLVTGLLAADRVDDAVALLEEGLAAPRDGSNGQRVDVRLARLGIILERPDWVEQGLAGAIDQANRATDHDRIMPLITVLVDAGRPAQAEELIAARLGTLVRNPANFDGSTHRYNDEMIELLTNLAQIYHDIGRHSDVLTLIEQAPWWGTHDLASILGQQARSDRSGTPRLGHLVAAALADAGRVADARRVLDATMDKAGDDDRDYRLLISLAGDNVLERLDTLAGRDRFEERPLIWKAYVLRRQGRLDEALAVIKQAIEIDPSDGEQGHGRRMQAYAELAAIHTDRGEHEEAELFEGAVSAIRLSERADRFYAAGLLSRALDMYEDALGLFADAYCIQSRLALRMIEQGRFDEAHRHYQRAFELMPDSFGRIESHCFGCERAFKGQLAESIAEQVFTDRVARTPDKPQVHYLLGYLREDQHRYVEAAEHYQQAVALDPDYYNAWRNLYRLTRNIYLPHLVLDAAVLNQHRLDPLGRHGQPNLKGVRDLPAVWRAVQTTAGYVSNTADQVYPMPAAAARLAKPKHQDPMDIEAMMWQLSENQTSEALPATPGDALADHQTVSAACYLFEVFLVGAAR